MAKNSQAVHKAQLLAGTDLTQAELIELAEVREGLFSLGRRKTGEAIALGGYLVRAKAILPEKALGKWVKEACGFTPRTARNYIGVAEHLAPHRDRLEAVGVAPTVLFALVGAKDDAIDRVLSALEAGERLTVKQVKAMVGIVPTPKPKADNALDLGGLAGLRRAAEMKTKADMAEFYGMARSILQAVQKALEPLEKNRGVKKGALCDAVVLDCRHAHDLLNSIAAPMEADYAEHMNWRPAHLPEGSAWRRVQALLRRMGGVDSWPDRTKLVPWLQDEVIPALRFVVHGEPLSDATLTATNQVASGLVSMEAAEPVEAMSELMTIDTVAVEVKAARKPKRKQQKQQPIPPSIIKLTKLLSSGLPTT
ncbi:hypothetical protein [Hoeflea sp.]|uniref:hypothetical protein n=1 Tax=Hoeflea sp. TaxID=1940281 RepID=UPI003A8E939A